MRLRHSYMFYGASRTGRWAGRGVQLQNLPRGTVKAENYDLAVDTILALDIDTLRDFGEPLEVVSSCLRGAFRAPEGSRFVVSDLNAIEVRVLAWLSNCQPVLDVFEKSLDPYIDFATKMYRAPYDSITKLQRQVAKSAVLGCGYMLSGGVLKADKHGDEFKSGFWGYAEAMGVTVTQDEAQRAVDTFRRERPEVVRYWYALEDAALGIMKNQGPPVQVGRVTIGLKPGKVLWVTLPSGRRLHYLLPRLEPGKYSKPEMTYESQIAGKTWGRRKLYGGLLTENLVQAVARDVLAEGLLVADAAGFEIVGHTHDEIITVVPYSSSLTLTGLNGTLSRQPNWAPGLPLKADGYESEVYRK